MADNPAKSYRNPLGIEDNPGYSQNSLPSGAMMEARHFRLFDTDNAEFAGRFDFDGIYFCLQPEVRERNSSRLIEKSFETVFADNDNVPCLFLKADL